MGFVVAVVHSGSEIGGQDKNTCELLNCSNQGTKV